MSAGKVLVTGATGFLGQRVVPRLVDRGWNVVTVGRTPSDQEGVTRHHVADLLEPGARKRVLSLEEPDAILHLAWCTEHGVFWSSNENLKWAAATLDLAMDFAEQGGKHFVGAGSCAEYAWVDDQPLSEDSKRGAPETLYGSCKRATSDMLERYFSQRNVEFSWGRVFFVYGAGEGEGKFITSAIRTMSKGDVFVCKSPQLVRDFIYIDDVAEAFCKMLDGTVGGVYNVGSGHGTALGAIEQCIANRLQGVATDGGFLAKPSVEPAVIADVRKASLSLGFAAETSLESGIAAHMAGLAAESLSV